MKKKLKSNRELEASTAEHYNRFPLEFLTADDENDIESQQPLPFRNFVKTYLKEGINVCDIGCGPGRAVMYLAQKGFNIVAVDISMNSLLMARDRHPGGTFILSSNMALPFVQQYFDAVVSDGVIHHTPDPDKSFSENARILKQGGMFYLGVYKRKGYYYYIYTYFGRPVRWLEKRKLGRYLIKLFLLPVYYLVHLIKTRGKRELDRGKKLFL